MSLLARFFEFEKHGTTLSREIIAGLTTFTTMSYIVVVNPNILSSAGIPKEPSFVATVVAAVCRRKTAMARSRRLALTMSLPCASPSSCAGLKPIIG